MISTCLKINSNFFISDLFFWNYGDLRSTENISASQLYYVFLKYIENEHIRVKTFAEVFLTFKRQK